MNALTWARLAANAVLTLGLFVMLAAILLNGPVSMSWVWALGGFALVGGLAQFVVSILKPGSIKPTWDEQNVAAHKGAYQFGYWAALLAFWVLVLLLQLQVITAAVAFLSLAPILIAAPSLWMVAATLMGRAG